MLSPANVATPATAATVFVPVSVPLLGLVPIATVTLPVKPVAVLPLASWAVTCTAGVIAAPAVVVLGCTLNTNWVAVPAMMLNAVLVARSEEHTSELQSHSDLVCRLLLEKKKKQNID